ncbi:hypothetical protein [Enterovirga sp.]|uniref:hypothetical protein n=1 Tax=Enterovirga sp. TaxID=2026350 RepID=UPI002612A696|nr:hypothetical protein [Enterovirga sp.]MDB5590450.1 hypothetical protein [Enterovirga sp.]
MLDPAAFATEPAPGRECGTCTLCCKVYDVPSLLKPAGQWCRHCRPGRGCGIHETRPQHCRSFHCLWMTQGWLGPDWKPERAKMVLTIDPATRFLLVQVDPGSANAWRADPYYRQLKQWAAAAMPRRQHVVVFLNKSATVILPDRDVPLGVMGPGDRIVARERRTASGMTLDVEKVAGPE